MSDSGSQAVLSNEVLIRFITVARWLRSDQTIRPDAFIPPKNLEFSVTRQSGLSTEEIWQIGRSIVAVITEKHSAELQGRADLIADVVSKLNLKTERAPLVDNQNHAHIVGWPSEKPAQKIIAQQLAAAAKFAAIPV